jgi:hypothetical protein
MTTGLPCSFGRSGLMLYKEQAEGRGIGLARDEELTFATNLSVAHGVAASSAFPPMFPPLKIDHKLLDCSEESFPSVHYITDGGVFDNMGMDRPLWWYNAKRLGAIQPADDIKAFLISDAEGRFNQVLTKPWRFKFALPRNVRATDVLMRRASTLNWKFLTGLSDLGLTLIRIPGSSVDSASAGELELAQAIRTDLDRFSNLEIEELVRAGFRSAWCELVRLHWIATDTPHAKWCPVSVSNLTREQRARRLAGSRFRRWMPLALGLRDWAWWLLFAICACLLYLWAFHRR